MSYTIKGEQGGNRVVATRNSPASAVVLAMKWAENGYQSIRIVNRDGRAHDVSGARQRLARGLRL